MGTIRNIRNSRFLKSPYLEIIIMISSILLAFFGLFVLSLVPDTVSDGEMATSSISLITAAFFILSVAIAMISVIAGIGGGVIFTPLMLAFTGINSLIIRGTGLIVAMFSGLISTGIFIKKGLGNFKLFMALTISQGVGAFIGASLAVIAAKQTGDLGEGLTRAALGAILALIAVYFLLGGRKMEWPVIKKVDRFTQKLNISGKYFDEADGMMHDYKVTRALLGIFLLFFVGLVGGFFGMGGGWAITPSLNLGMAMPLKLAVANSGIILGIGSCISIWPYIHSGSIIPLFVLPWLAGQVIGGFIGSFALARIKVKVVRLILIGIMFFTSFGLITKGMNVLGVMPEIPAIVQILVFTVVFSVVIIVVVQNSRKESGQKAANKSMIGEKISKSVDYYIKPSQRVYADIIHWITLCVSIAALFVPLFVLADPGSNFLDPNQIFGAVFRGAGPQEIWRITGAGDFPGVWNFIKNISFADSWALLTIMIGCAVGLFAVLPAFLIQLFKEKDIQNGILGMIMSALIIFAVIGII